MSGVSKDFYTPKKLHLEVAVGTKCGRNQARTRQKSMRVEWIVATAS